MSREHLHAWQQVVVAAAAGLPLACLVGGMLILYGTPAPRNIAAQLAMWLSAAIWIAIIGAAPFFQRRRVFIGALAVAYALAGGFFWMLHS